MKKTVAVLLLTILTIALLLCGCDANLQKEGTPIIKKTEIREGDKSVTVVYEDGYELSCVQALTDDGRTVTAFKTCIGSTVNGISKERMPNRCHVHADLVGASRFELTT